MQKILPILATCLFASTAFAAWGLFNEKADEPIPCGGKTPFPWWIERHEALVKEAKKGETQIAFFGDSLTDFWSKEGKKVWEKEYAPLKATNFGIGGDQTQYVIYRMTNGELEGMKPKVLVLEIGTNNLVKKFTPEETVIGITACVNLVREKLPDTKILLLALLPQGMPAKDKSRGSFDAVNNAIAKLDDPKKNIYYLDMNANYLDADGNLLLDLRTEDRAHISEKGYQVWADTMRPTLKKLLE